MGAIIALVNKKGENASEAAVAMLKILKNEQIEEFGIASPNLSKVSKNIEKLLEKDLCSPIIVGKTFSKILTTDKPQPTEFENATIVFEGRLYPRPLNISDAEAFALEAQRCRESVKSLLRKASGDFVFAIAEEKRVIAGRDTMGVYPLYYGENESFAALASERKALWKIGIKRAQSFPPGHVATFDRDGIKFENVRTLDYSEPKQITMRAAAKKLQKLLETSVMEKVAGLKHVAVAFSGGLDSSIIAYLAKKSGITVDLIHVSLRNQPETEYAKRVARELKLPIHVYLYEEDDVKRVLSKILWLIEGSDFVDVSIGVPFYWVAEKAAEMGFKVMLTGQSADELFGGYKRYVQDFVQYEKKKAHTTFFRDISEMHRTNFERDFKICDFHNVELRLPFAAYEIAKFAINLPVEVKIEGEENGLRKLVLRQVAENLGLPNLVTRRPKKAMQYATGVSKTLKNLAKKEGLTAKEYLQRKFQAAFKGVI